MTVQRYWCNPDAGSASPIMVPIKDGDWVLWKDVKPILEPHDYRLEMKYRWFASLVRYFLKSVQDGVVRVEPSGVLDSIRSAQEDLDKQWVLPK